VIDFGSSTILDGISTGQTSTSFAMAGTPRFMAPELVQDNDCGGHCRRTQGSDVWAYGCTSMQILVDEKPYSSSKSNLQVIHSLLQGRPPYKWDPEEALQWMLSKCCTWDPADRPTMDEITRGLVFTPRSPLTMDLSSRDDPKSPSAPISYPMIPLFFFELKPESV